MILREVQNKIQKYKDNNINGTYALWEIKELTYGEVREIRENTKRDARLLYETAKQHPLFCLFIILLIITASLFIAFPYWPLSLDGIHNPTSEANIKNQYFATVAQIMGTVGILVGLYYTGKSIKIAKEGQVADRFTKAIDQLGNDKLHIRLGGIYALGKILYEFEEAYWPIVEILTIFVKEKAPIKNDNIKVEDINDQNRVSLDIQAILTVLGKRKSSSNFKELNGLDLQKTCLIKARLEGTYFDNANFEGAQLIGAYFHMAHLNRAKFAMAHLEKAYFNGAHLEGANLIRAHLKNANFMEARLQKALFTGADLTETNLAGAHLEGAVFKGADFTGANITGAFFKGAKLELEKIKKARGRQQAHFKGACIDGKIYDKDELLNS